MSIFFYPHFYQFHPWKLGQRCRICQGEEILFPMNVREEVLPARPTLLKSFCTSQLRHRSVFQHLPEGFDFGFVAVVRAYVAPSNSTSLTA